eukprot:scaffold2248_cov133-Isochrysis_galbana.AAC.11
MRCGCLGSHPREGVAVYFGGELCVLRVVPIPNELHSTLPLRMDLGQRQSGLYGLCGGTEWVGLCACCAQGMKRGGEAGGRSGGQSHLH